MQFFYFTQLSNDFYKENKSTIEYKFELWAHCSLVNEIMQFI